LQVFDLGLYYKPLQMDRLSSKLVSLLISVTSTFSDKRTSLLRNLCIQKSGMFYCRGPWFPTYVSEVRYIGLMHCRAIVMAPVTRLNDLPIPHSIISKSGILKGEYQCTVDLLFVWFGNRCMTTDNLCFYLQNRLIQTSQTGGQRYSDTSPFSIPCLNCHILNDLICL
jgi:hypothetical protein